MEYYPQLCAPHFIHSEKMPLDLVLSIRKKCISFCPKVSFYIIPFFIRKTLLVSHHLFIHFSPANLDFSDYGALEEGDKPVILTFSICGIFLVAKVLPSLLGLQLIIKFNFMIKYSSHLYI